MDDFAVLSAITKKRDLENAKKYKADSKERLKKICITKVRTTMIGALQSIEDHLLSRVPKSGQLTNEELTLQRMYDEIRKEILDKGNNQIRHLEEEFNQYEVEWKRYTIQLPVIRRD